MVVEVFFEVAFFNFFVQVFVGSCYYLDIDVDFFVFVYVGDLVFLQCLKYFSLSGKVYIVDFIQEEGVVVSLFKFIDVLFVSGSKCVFFMAK